MTDPEVDCRRDSSWVLINYYDERDWTYETRGWVSELASTSYALARAGEYDAKWRVLGFLFSLQNEDGSFPDKWGFKTEQPGSSTWLWASGEHSVIRTSIIFRVLSSLLVSTRGTMFPKEIASARETLSGRRIVAQPGDGTDKVSDSSPELTLKYSRGIADGASAFPNPSRKGMTIRLALPPAASQARLTIIDITGRTVRSFEIVREEGISLEVIWDGADEEGNPVAPGVYFAQAIHKNWQSVKKLVILSR